MEAIDSNELIREKTLRDVYWASRRLQVSRFNQFSTIIVFLLLGAYGVFSPESAQSIAEKTRIVSDYAFAFSTSILSFLIAGFTIYVTVTKTELFLFLASTRHENSGLPWIKHISFHFLRVMALYVAACVFYVSVKLFASTSGPLSLLLGTLLQDPSQTKIWLARIGLSTVGALLVHLILLLQSFIFNIYHTAMLSVCWERENLRKPTKPRVGYKLRKRLRDTIKAREIGGRLRFSEPRLKP